MTRIHWTLLALAALAAPLAAPAQEAYPRRPIRIIVPFTPGTGIDILARTLGQKLGERWNSPVVVENRPGASGNIGTDAVAKAPADGYTLLMTANTIVLNRSLFRAIPYDPVKDFAPVAPLALGSMALVVHPSIPARSVRELVALAKAQPGKLDYGSPGRGTPHHLAMELLKSATGIDLVHVPYKGSGPAVSDLLGGQIKVMFLPVHVALPQVQAGKLAILASGGLVRSAATPDVATLAEAAGIRDIDVDIWYALYAPAATPGEIVARLNAEMNAILKLAEVKDSLAKQGLITTGGSAADLARLTAADLDRWARIVREAKIEAE
jgi:tripartite-type tricarboxylate transporter receptor subunit TctC